MRSPMSDSSSVTSPTSFTSPKRSTCLMALAREESFPTIRVFTVRLTGRLA